MKWMLRSSGCFTGEHMQTNMVVLYRLVERVMASTPKRSLTGLCYHRPAIRAES